MKLLLFDIDGTLLLSHGAGRRLFEDVLSGLCGRPISTAEVSFSGRTDPLIVQETLEKADLPAAQIARILPSALEQYASRARYTPDDLQLLPGVRELLESLNALPNVQLGLLTGNLEHTAYLKLKGINLAHFFPFGAFGSDHANRSRLPDYAIGRARQWCGHTFSGSDVVIIGDSVHDVRCGKDNSLFTVAVASGFTPAEDLAAEQPDVLLSSLEDCREFIRRVLETTL